ncbi:MAG: hypothetical protein V1859_09410 [archaeon]
MKKSLILFFAIIIFSSFAIADAGPKPTAIIYVTYEGNAIEEDFRAVMLSCRPPEKRYDDTKLLPQLNITLPDLTKNCTWYPDMFAWGGECKDSKCRFGYMIPDDLRVAIYLPSVDKTFVSESIYRRKFNSMYTLEISKEGSTVISESARIIRAEHIWFTSIALFVTLFFEVSFGILFLLMAKVNLKIIWTIILANAISVHIVWLAFTAIRSFSLFVIASELFAFLFEAFFIYAICKKDISLKKSFLLSFIINAASFLFGGIILLIVNLLFGIFPY